MTAFYSHNLYSYYIYYLRNNRFIAAQYLPKSQRREALYIGDAWKLCSAFISLDSYESVIGWSQESIKLQPWPWWNYFYWIAVGIMILADLEDIVRSNPQRYHVKSKDAVGHVLFWGVVDKNKIALVSKVETEVLFLENKFAFVFWILRNMHLIIFVLVNRQNCYIHFTYDPSSCLYLTFLFVSYMPL